jgi:hypothetical protein
LGNLHWIGTDIGLWREAGFGQITTAAHPNRQAMMAVITPLMGVKNG